MKRALGYIVIGVLVFFSCKNNSYEELNLLNYGMPLTIAAPAEATIESENYTFQKSLQIKDNKCYDMVISQSDAYGTVASSVADLKKHTTENPFFVEFLSEEEDGFIYKVIVDSSFTNYNFRHIKQFGDKEYIFQAGFVQQLSEKEVRDLYQKAKEAH